MYYTTDLILLVFYFVSSIVFCTFYILFYNLQLSFMLFCKNLHARLKHLLAYLLTYLEMT